MRRGRLSASNVLFVCSVATIAALVVPWTDFQHHTHWAKVQWIPFVSPPIKLSDVIENVLLYAPFGLFFPAAPPKWRWRLLIATAVLLSSATEWTQVYSHTRFPSTTDVSCNVIGAVLGRLVADRRI